MSEYRIGDYNRAGYLAFMFCMAITVVFFIYIAFIHPGVDLKEIQIPDSAKDTKVETSAPAAPTAEQPK